MFSKYLVALLAVTSATFTAANPLPASKPDCPPGDTNPECANPFLHFSSLALRSASPIHFQPLRARDSGIYVGGKSEPSCPVPGIKCPKKKDVVFTIDALQATAFLDVAVPGGQQLYVAPDGALSYTVPHSAVKPPGSFTSGFGYFENPNGGVDTWSFTGAGGATGFVACLCEADDSYRVYANTRGFKKQNKKGCLGFDALFQRAKGPSAFQYD